MRAKVRQSYLLKSIFLKRCLEDLSRLRTAPRQTHHWHSCGARKGVLGQGSSQQALVDDGGPQVTEGGAPHVVPQGDVKAAAEVALFVSRQAADRRSSKQPAYNFGPSLVLRTPEKTSGFSEFSQHLPLQGSEYQSFQIGRNITRIESSNSFNPTHVLSQHSQNQPQPPFPQQCPLGLAAHWGGAFCWEAWILGERALPQHSEWRRRDL